jgi:hypothetical protein
MTSLRAARKKAIRTFKVGDLVTWGHGITSHRVIEVVPLGVFVASPPKHPRYFVPFDPGKRETRFGPLRKVET